MGQVMSKLMGKIYTPPPRWFIITKKLINLVTTFVVSLMMILGKRADDQILLIIKLSESFLLEVIDSLMMSSEYVISPDTGNPIPADASAAEKNE